jgi:hypothetical protein
MPGDRGGHDEAMLGAGVVALLGFVFTGRLPTHPIGKRGDEG